MGYTWEVSYLELSSLKNRIAYQGDNEETALETARALAKKNIKYIKIEWRPE